MKEKIPPLKNKLKDIASTVFLLTHKSDYVEACKHVADISHIHDVCEIYLNLSGNVSFVVENKVYPVERGDMIITRPDEIHHCVYRSDGVSEHFCLWLDGAPKSILGAFYDRQSGDKNLISLPEELKENVIECFFSLEKQGENLSAEGLNALFGILSAIDKNRGVYKSQNTIPALLLKVTDYIDRNFAEDCSIEYICKRFFVSRSTLCRLFRSSLSTTPSKYVTSRRLSEAKKMLKLGLSVSDVCFSCGFSDYSHFIALFKSRFGITPMKYSRQCGDGSLLYK